MIAAESSGRWRDTGSDIVEAGDTGTVEDTEAVWDTETAETV